MMHAAPVILDIAGTRLTAADRQRLGHPLTGGIILFARNWESRAQLSALCAEIKHLRADLLICVDHEGGRVQRFKTDGFTHLSPMRALGELWMQDGKGGPGSGAMRATNAASAAGYVLAAELRACGVDLSFTPVLDLDHGPSTVIGDRAFARDPRVVSLLAKSLMHGLLRAGPPHEHFGNLAKQLRQGQRGFFQFEPASLNFRQIEDIVDDRQQMAAGTLDPLERLIQLCLAERTSHQVGRTEDGIHRRPDFVAHVGQESTLGSGR